MPTSRHLLLATAIVLGAYASHPSDAWAAEESPTFQCHDTESAHQTYLAFGERLLDLTRRQIYQAADAKYLIGLKAVRKGWSTQREQEFIAKFLESDEYRKLQAERLPYEAVMNNVKARWRRTTETDGIGEMCALAQDANAAVSASFAINIRELKVLALLLEAEQ
jgi:hypothetical protein